MADEKVSSLGSTRSTSLNVGHDTYRDVINTKDVKSPHTVLSTSNKPTTTPDGKPVTRKTPTG